MTTEADRKRRRDREQLIADLAQARFLRRRRGIALRLPSTLPIPRPE